MSGERTAYHWKETKSRISVIAVIIVWRWRTDFNRLVSRSFVFRGDGFGSISTAVHVVGSVRQSDGTVAITQR